MVTARSEFAQGALINHWKYPMKDSMVNLKQSYLACIEAGDLIYGCYSEVNYNAHFYMKGRPLAEMTQSVKSSLAFVTKSNIREYYDALLFLELSANCLQDKVEIPLTELAEYGAKIIPMSGTNLSQVSILHDHYIKLCYLLGAYELAIDAGKQGQPYLQFTVGVNVSVQGQVYYALAIAAHYHKATPQKKRQYLRTLKVLQAQLNRWGNWSIYNYKQYDLLVSAEIARIKGQELVAGRLYSQAIETAQQNDFVNFVAVANECAARFYIECDKPFYAKTHLQQAHYAYAQWGALAKCKMLEQQYAEYFPSADLAIEELARTASKATTETSLTNIDVLSIFKFTQAISSEIQLDKLLQKLLVVLLQNAGTQRGMLLAKKDETWYVEAEGTIAEQHLYLSPTELIDSRTDLPLSLIQYVQRTQKLVVLQSAKEIEQSALEDAYIAKEKPKALLIMPILYQGQLNNILFLESRATSHVFTPEHIKTLQMLASQAAISLENARLYYQATHDSLTGLANRNLLHQMFTFAVGKAARAKTQIAILFLDLDGFKQINDTLGHEIGDKLLQYFAEQLKACLREGDLAARLGGDEFIIMLEGIKDFSEVRETVHRLLQRLQQPVDIQGNKIVLSSSVGISLYPGDGEDILSLLKQADVALYQAKATGKGQYQFYTVKK